MTHFPWFKNTSRIDYTGYREFLSLTRYVHASRAYYSSLSAIASCRKSESRQAMLYTHQAMLKAKSFLVHYKPKSSLIRRLVFIEWQYLLKSNQLWMPRVSLAEPLSQAAKFEMKQLTLGYLNEKKRAIRGNDLDSCIEQVHWSLLMQYRDSSEFKRTKNFRVSLAMKSLIRSRKRIDFDFDELVEQCDFVSSHLLLSPQRTWDYKQSSITSNDRLLGIYRQLSDLSLASEEGKDRGSEVRVISERIDDTNLKLIEAQYVSARTMLLFHFPEIICNYEKRGHV
jgi:hypothetical protein